MSGDGLQPIVLQADRVAYQRDAVEHHAAGDIGATIAREVRVLAKPDPARNASEFALDAESLAAARQHLQVEVDHVPADEHVGVECADPGDERLEQGSLVGVRMHRSTLGCRAREQVCFLVSVVRDERCARDRARVGRGFEVERYDREIDVDFVGRSQYWIVEDAQPVFVCARLALDLDPAPNPQVGEEAIGKAHVGFVGRAAT